MNAKTMRDLLESGVPRERIEEAWIRAKVRLEKAMRNGGVCRICGEEIARGEEVVVSEDRDLVGLYGAFWSLKVRAHRKCYEGLVLPRGLSEKSNYRLYRYCPRCGSWIQIYDGSDDHWPGRDNPLQCPNCGKQLRSRPRDAERFKAPRIIADIRLKMIPMKGQLTLEPFITGSRIIVRRGGEEEIYYACE